MVLVDTSIWIDHLSIGNKLLEKLLLQNSVVVHPYIIGELACGTMKNRRLILDLLQSLPATPLLTEEEFFRFIEQHHLYGKGPGFIDMHLLGSALLSQSVIYSRDKALIGSAEQMGIAFRCK